MNLEVVADEAWSDAVVSRWGERLRETPDMRVCLPTGDTPRPVYKRLARSGADLSRARVVLLDEFALPDGHAARCDSMLRRDLFDLLDHEPAEFHTIDIQSADPEDAAERHGALAAEAPLDLTILGLGGNGHVGLNEPGSGPDEATRVVALHQATIGRLDDYEAGTRAEWGITLGTAALLASNEVWLLVSGAHKAEILAKTLNGPIGPEIPATYLRDHPHATVFADESAAALL